MKSKSVLLLNKINTIFIFTYVLTKESHPRFVTMGDIVFLACAAVVVAEFSTALRESLRACVPLVQQSNGLYRSLFFTFICDPHVLYSIDLYSYSQLQDSDSIYWFSQRKYMPKLHKAIIFLIVVFLTWLHSG